MSEGVIWKYPYEPDNFEVLYYEFTPKQIKNLAASLLRDFIRLRKTDKASDRLTAKHLLKELFDES